MSTAARFLGITVLPEYLQCESIDAVLDRLIDSCGVTAVATSPYVMAPCEPAEGSREPPVDAGAGSVRLLDRPLWGQRELWVRTAPSFEPNQQLYAQLRYQPPLAAELTHEQGHVLDDFLEAAKKRGLQVFFQVQAAIPPGYRVQFGGPTGDDVPQLPDGRVPARRVANNGCLASPHIIAYQHALTRDLCRRYPLLDGIRFDWPEYPPYLLDSVFLDFSPHVATAAGRLGFDFDDLREDARQLYDLLHGQLTDQTLGRWAAALEEGQWGTLIQQQFPGMASLCRLKARLVEELLTGFRGVMDDEGARAMQLAPSAFPPPWSFVSGMDFRRIASLCDSVTVKLYGMHWAMMLHFYGEQLLEANPALSEPVLVPFLVKLLGIADDQGLPRLEDYRYPGPDQPHPIGAEAQTRKIASAQNDAGQLPVLAFAHGYGPLDDFRHRMQTAWTSTPHGMWVNRYGYLSDEKLKILGEVTSS